MKANRKYNKANLDNSNLSGSTFNDLIDRKLQKATDKKMTSLRNYKSPKIYDAGGDLSKQWFVHYSFRDLETGRFVRHKIFRDINSGTTRQERMERAKLVMEAIKELLEEGYIPGVYNEHQKASHNVIWCIDKYLEEIEQNRRANTYRKYKWELGVFRRWLIKNGYAHSDISEIRKSTVFAFLTAHKSEWTGRTYNAYLSDVSRFFNYYLNNYDDYLYKNPTTSIESQPVDVKGNAAYDDLTFEKVRETIAETDPGLWIICQVVYYAALRNEAEAINLKVRDINLKSGQITVPASITKGRRIQIIPIYPEFRKVLEGLHLDQYDPDYFIFGRNDQPGPVRCGQDFFAKRFRDIKKILGLGREYGIYSFKHTRACHMVDDGAELYEIQTLFRHEDLVATMKYLRSVGRVISKRDLTPSREL